MIDYQFILQIRFLVCGHRILTKVLKFKKLCSTKLQKEVDNFKIERDLKLSLSTLHGMVEISRWGSLYCIETIRLFKTV